jgi:hypothetical protein
MVAATFALPKSSQKASQIKSLTAIAAFSLPALVVIHSVPSLFC